MKKLHVFSPRERPVALLLRERLAAEGIAARLTDYSPVGIHILSSVHPIRLTGFQDGLFTVQDESSQLAAIFLAPEPGQDVLDLCAAPGGKTTHLAQLMENRGTLLACDLDARKLRRIEETAARLDVSLIETQCLDASRPLSSLKGRKFNRILVDAPCTGLGVIRRNPEAKWRLTPADASRLARLQSSILHNAADLDTTAFVAHGGWLGWHLARLYPGRPTRVQPIPRRARHRPRLDRL